MARNRDEELRREGVSFAIRFLESHGNDLNALKAEAKKRGALDIPLAISKKAADEFSERVKRNTLQTVLALTELVLRDEFDFGAKRLNRFRSRFNDKADSIVVGYTSWEETLGILEDECGIKLHIDWNGGDPTKEGRDG